MSFQKRSSNLESRLRHCTGWRDISHVTKGDKWRLAVEWWNGETETLGEYPSTKTIHHTPHRHA